jgi:hypothetical protein
VPYWTNRKKVTNVLANVNPLPIEIPYNSGMYTHTFPYLSPHNSADLASIAAAQILATAATTPHDPAENRSKLCM